MGKIAPSDREKNGAQVVTSTSEIVNGLVDVEGIERHESARGEHHFQCPYQEENQDH